MPFYDYECGNCGHIQEEMRSVEKRHWATCELCGTKIKNALPPTGVAFTGDLPTTGNWNYYDENLGVKIESKQQRSEEMKRQGLEPYSPDLELKKHRDEARYILDHAEKGDPEAGKQAQVEMKTAGDKRRNSAVNEVFDRFDKSKQGEELKRAGANLLGN